MIADAEPFALSGVIVSEILQGLRRDFDQIEHHLSQWETLEPLGFSTYSEAAAIFRVGRATGFSLTTIDTLIAAIALDHRAVLFTVDQDFSRIARITRLQLYSDYLPPCKIVVCDYRPSARLAARAKP